MSNHTPIYEVGQEVYIKSSCSKAIIIGRVQRQNGPSFDEYQVAYYFSGERVSEWVHPSEITTNQSSQDKNIGLRKSR